MASAVFASFILPNERIFFKIVSMNKPSLSSTLTSLSRLLGSKFTAIHRYIIDIAIYFLTIRFASNIEISKIGEKPPTCHVKFTKNCTYAHVLIEPG